MHWKWVKLILQSLLSLPWKIHWRISFFFQLIITDSIRFSLLRISHYRISLEMSFVFRGTWGTSKWWRSWWRIESSLDWGKFWNSEIEKSSIDWMEALRILHSPFLYWLQQKASFFINFYFYWTSYKFIFLFGRLCGFLLPLLSFVLNHLYEGNIHWTLNETKKGNNRKYKRTHSVRLQASLYISYIH